jgi:hypothetical protein
MKIYFYTRFQGLEQFSFFDVSSRYDYFYQTLFEGQKLWAANLEHIDWLIDYLGADQRHRHPNVNRSMASRLPNWMKAADKTKIVRALEKMKAMPLPK